VSIVELKDWASLVTIVIGFITVLAFSSRRIDSHRNELEAHIADARSDLKSEVRATRTELKGDIAQTRAELTAEGKATRTELSTFIADLRSEMKAEFGRMDSRLQTIEQRTYDLSTRLPTASS
jgi:hypothetical protein